MSTRSARLAQCSIARTFGRGELRGGRLGLVGRLLREQLLVLELDTSALDALRQLVTLPPRRRRLPLRLEPAFEVGARVGVSETVQHRPSHLLLRFEARVAFGGGWGWG